MRKPDSYSIHELHGRGWVLVAEFSEDGEIACEASWHATEAAARAAYLTLRPRDDKYGHYYLNEDGDEDYCGDESGLCPACFEEEAAYWGGYFGISDSQTREERQAKLKAMDPRIPTAEDMDKLRRAKERGCDPDELP